VCLGQEFFVNEIYNTETGCLQYQGGLFKEKEIVFQKLEATSSFQGVKKFYKFLAFLLYSVTISLCIYLPPG
jgi:hypothetical protein